MRIDCKPMHLSVAATSRPVLRRFGRTFRRGGSSRSFGRDFFLRLLRLRQAGRRTRIGNDFRRASFSSAAFCAASCVPFVPYFLISTATFSDGCAPTPNQ